MKTNRKSETLDEIRSLEEEILEDLRTRAAKELGVKSVSIWLFHYHQFVEALRHWRLLSANKGDQERNEELVKNSFIPKGHGTIGYILDKIEEECVNDTFDDPRGAVAIEDSLIGNLAWGGFPICNNDDEIISIISFFPTGERWAPLEGAKKGLSALRRNAQDLKVLRLLTYLETLRQELYVLYDDIEFNKQTLTENVQLLLEKIRELAYRVTGFQNVVYLEKTNKETFRISDHKYIKHDVLRTRLRFLGNLQWICLQERSTLDQALKSCFGEPIERFERLQLILSESLRIEVLLNTKDLQLETRLKDYFGGYKNTFQEVFDSILKTDNADSKLKRVKIAKDVIKSLFQLSLAAIFPDASSKSGSDPKEDWTTLERFLTNSYSYSLKEIPNRIELRHEERDSIVGAILLQQRVDNWQVTSKSPELDRELKNPGNLKVLFRVVDEVYEKQPNDPETIQNELLQLYPLRMQAEFHTPEIGEKKVTLRTIKGYQVAFSKRNFVYPLDLYLNSSGFEEFLFKRGFANGQGRASEDVINFTETNDDGCVKTSVYHILCEHENRTSLIAIGPAHDAGYKTHLTGLIEFAEKHFRSIVLAETRKKLLATSMKAGVAAIMSRNGSHNLGSHVLSAVVQNISVLPDDQILFGYIQQRMDFVAQITTEIPQWYYSCPISHDLMRRLYIQRHLLNYICDSEHLSAYEYQSAQTEQINPKQYHKIVIQLYDLFKGEFVISPENDSEGKGFGEIAHVAIPGGVIGQHAFYTIIENLLRNTAKHNWMNAKDRPENLQITVGFDYNPEKSYVLFKVWDNVSDVFDSKNGHRSPEEMEVLAKQLLPPEKGIEEAMPLHFKINRFLKKNFIDETTGRLRYENWGLAEMKICAAFLNRIEATEFINEDKVLFDDKGIEVSGYLSAVGYKPSNDQKYRLCYQFPIPKPKELLIVGDQESLAGLDIGGARREGVYADVDPKHWDFEMVAFTSPDQLNRSKILDYEELPIRLVLFSKKGDAGDPKGLVKSLVEKRRLVWEQTDLATLFRDLRGNEKLTAWEQRKLLVYTKWLSGYHNFGGIQHPVGIYLETDVTPADKGPSLQIQEFAKSIQIPGEHISSIAKILVKYEENIETLPKVFRASTAGQKTKDERNAELVLRNAELDFNTIKLARYCRRNEAGVILERHSTNPAPGVQYQEALSGSQTYFGLLNDQCSSFFANKLTLMLLENALLRIKIADERYARFYLALGIQEKRVFDKGRLKPVFSFSYRGNTTTIIMSEEIKNDRVRGDAAKGDYHLDFESRKPEFDALIIHQTILDEAFDGDKTRIEAFVASLKDLNLIVVVTSGRGKPDKLPSNAKFMPFSNLESFVIKSYHEKFLLTQILMNLTRSEHIYA